MVLLNMWNVNSAITSGLHLRLFILCLCEFMVLTKILQSSDYKKCNFLYPYQLGWTCKNVIQVCQLHTQSYMYIVFLNTNVTLLDCMRKIPVNISYTCSIHPKKVSKTSLKKVKPTMQQALGGIRVGNWVKWGKTKHWPATSSSGTDIGHI